MLREGLGVIARNSESLPHVFHAFRQMYPAMHALLVHRERRLRKVGISEGTNGYGDAAFVVAIDQVVHRGSAGGTEVEGHLAALISDARPCPGLPGDGGSFEGEPGLSAEDATRPSLAG